MTPFSIFLLLLRLQCLLEKDIFVNQLINGGYSQLFELIPWFIAYLVVWSFIKEVLQGSAVDGSLRGAFANTRGGGRVVGLSSLPVGPSSLSPRSRALSAVNRSSVLETSLRPAPSSSHHRQPPGKWTPSAPFYCSNDKSSLSSRRYHLQWHHISMCHKLLVE